MLQSKMGLKAQHAHWEVLNSKGETLREGVQHNLVLNQARDTLLVTQGMRRLTAYACVGTGSTAPAPAQTALDNEVARTDAVPNGEVEGWTQTAPGVYECKRVKQFGSAAVGNLNLTEWGFSPGAAIGANLAIRELFRDANGNPITLTLSAGQSLRITHKLQVTLGPVAPVNGSINIVGKGVRTGKLFIKDSADLTAFEAMLTGEFLAFTNLIYDDPVQYAGFGAAYQSLNATLDAYVPGSKQRKMQPVTYDQNAANNPIYGFAISRLRDFSDYYSSPNYGICFKFDPGQEFTKDNLHSLTIDDWTVSWT
jgi:hypothetical protein